MPKSETVANLTTQVDSLFAEWNRPNTPGAAIAVIHDGEIIYKNGYGMANLEYAIPITPKSIFHVASLSKQFTSFAINLLALEGKLSLDDEIHTHFPEFGDFGKPITLRNLRHHTSGLRDQWDLLSLAGWRMEDVITEQDILDIAWKQRELNFEPGAEYLYCNTGYTLLAVVVKRVSGKSLREFTQERIFTPLEMKDTHFHDDHRMIVPNRAYSYAPRESDFEHSILSFSNVGTTSLFTTVEDLAKWDQNFYDPVVGGTEAVAMLHDRFVLNDGTTIAYAAGLSIGEYRGLKRVDHSGADAGYRAHIVRFPDERFTVTVLSNRADANPGALAYKVADIYLADRLASVPVPATAEPAAPKSEAPMDLGADELAEYCGDFFSDELTAIYTLRVSDGKLLLRARKGEIPLQPTAQPDTFDSEAAKITFLRTRRKRIKGFTFNTGRVRNLYCRPFDVGY